MMQDDALERLSKKLNAGATDDSKRRTRLFPKGPQAPEAWREEPSAPDTELFMAPKRQTSHYRALFVGSLVFFALAVGASAFLLFSGQNVVSAKNVDVAVLGPAQIAAGDTLSLQVVVTNRNTVPMNLTDLVVEFPAGTRSAADVSSPLPRVRISIGTIAPGESINRTVTAILFGRAGDEQGVKARAEYHVPSSNAILVSDTSYSVRISQSPASIAVSAPAEAVSGQALSLTVTVTSNSPKVLTNMLLVAAYPSGFSFAGAAPAPSSGTTAWNLGDIEPGGTRTVVLHGAFSGEDGDERVITFSAGSAKDNANAEIAAPLATGDADLTVTKPFISADIALAGAVSEAHSIQRGAAVLGSIQWTNNLPNAVQDLSVVLTLNGRIVDPSSVSAVNGFYSSSRSTITWDKSTFADFANVQPGASGTLAFSFAALPPGRGTFRSPTVSLSVSVHASRASEGNVPETVTSTASTKAFVATDLSLAASLAHASGPLPPKANTETAYTVAWTLSNSANDVANAAVTAALPSYVRFIGAVSPASENLSFDARTGTLTWQVGDVGAAASRTVSFTVGITPSVSQAGTAPVVVDGARATAFDRFIQDSVSAAAPPLDIRASSASSADTLVTE